MKKKLSVCVVLLFAFTLTLGAHATALGVMDIIPAGSDHDFEERGYFVSRPDYRKCASPFCGGFFVKQVNQVKTRCFDGSYQDECYVSTIDWGSQGKGSTVYSTTLLLQGSIETLKIGYVGHFGVFKIKTAYLPVAKKQVQESQVFVGLVDNGIRCITTPCFSTDEYLLNSAKIRLVSDIDLHGVGATEKQVNTAYSQIAQRTIVLASGFNRQDQGVFGPGLTFVAKQFYVPIQTLGGQCSNGYYMASGKCITPFGCVMPTIELHAHSGTAPLIDSSIESIKVTETIRCVKSCQYPAISNTSAQCDVFYP